MFIPEDMDAPIWKLANAMCEGTISDEELRELELLLESDPVARDFYIDFIIINSEISWLIRARQHSSMDLGPRISVDVLENPTKPKKTPVVEFLSNWADFLNQHSPLSFILLFVVLATMLFATTYFISSRNSGTISPEPLFAAQLTATKDCRWAMTTDAPKDMEALQTGRRLNLEKGLAEITYSNQAKVVIEGPASYTVESQMSGLLSLGKLFAQADAAQSRQFTILTPNAKFVDMGTEFGVEIDAKGRSSLAVFSGKVNASAKLAEGRWTNPIAVKRNEAVVCYGINFTPCIAHRNNFPSMRPLPPPPADANYQRWSNAVKELQNRQDLVAYYDFQQDVNNPNVLVNRAPTGAVFNGQIQKATWTQGRFDGKSALKFAAVDSGVLVNIPGQYEQITLIAWVKINELKNYWNGLLMTNDFSIPGQLHLEIRSDAHIAMYVVQKNRTRESLLSADPIPDDCLHRWCMIAAVIDRTSQGCSMYVNDMCVLDHTSMAQIPPIIIGPATIAGQLDKGNDADVAVPIRNLACSMDSFLIFNSALTQDEIRRIYESGKPGVQ
jgi:hypothetical protein